WEEEISEVVDESRQTGFNVRHLRQEQKGPAAARNLGIRNSKGIIVAMTDSDTLADRSWLKKLYEALMGDPEAVAVEGQVYASNEGEFDPLGEGPTNRSGGVYLTCNCAYRRETLIDVGGFDETFPFPAYEDTELAARAQQLGRIIWAPEAVVIHPQRPLTLRAVLKKLRHWEYVLLMGRRYGYLAWKQYPVKHPGMRGALLWFVARPPANFIAGMGGMGVKRNAAEKLFRCGIVEGVGVLFVAAQLFLLASRKEGVSGRRFF